MVAYSTKQQRNEDSSRGVGVGLAGFVLGLLVAIGINSHAQVYMGATVGVGASKDGETTASRNVSRADIEPKSGAAQAYIGYRRGFIGAEAGILKLPTYSGYAEGANPVRSIHQEITASAFYGRAMLWSSTTPSVYGFAGLAHVRGRNHEYGLRQGVAVEHRNETSTWAPYVGGGIEAPLTGSLSVRAELGYLPKAVNSHWTGNRSYAVALVGLSGSF